MAIVVTGGAGYIGSHTTVELIQAGYEVIIVDNFQNSHRVVLDRIKEITGVSVNYYAIDLLNKKKLQHVFEENRVEAVIHFAGWKAVSESMENPIAYYKNNVAGTITLCEVMQQFQVKKLVFSSSATVYGIPEKLPITEEESVEAINPYGRTKQMVEQMLMDLSDSDSDWSISILRYFNPIGAHESGKMGEDPKGIPNNLVPYISQVAVGKLPKLKVYGDDYPTKDGSGVRDYIHVVDLGIGHVKALDQVLTSKGVKVYNLGTGKGYSVFDMIFAFEKASGRPIPFEVVARRPGDIATSFADPSKAKEELGFVASRDIHLMCEDTWRWQQQNPNGYIVMEKG